MSKFCKNCGGEIINNFWTICEKKSLNFKDIIFIIIDILRYVLAIFFLILGIGSIPKLLGFIFILLSISLLPFIYSLILNYFDSNINVKLIFILSYIIQKFMLVFCLFFTLCFVLFAFFGSYICFSYVIFIPNASSISDSTSG